MPSVSALKTSRHRIATFAGGRGAYHRGNAEVSAQGGPVVLVEEILRRKGRDVATIGRDATAAEAVAALRQWGVGALVVSSGDGAVDGIVSERDLVRALVAGPSVLDHPVHQFMSTDVVTCTHDTSTEELMAIMTDRRIRHVPVVDGGRLAGIVSIGDVVKVRVNELEAENGQLVDYIRTGR